VSVCLSVRLFVCLSVPAWAHSSKRAALPLQAAGYIDGLLQQRWANAVGSATFSGYAVAEHRLVYATVFIVWQLT